jgi:two-component system NtrC family sensor kinase
LNANRQAIAHEQRLAKPWFSEGISLVKNLKSSSEMPVSDLEVSGTAESAERKADTLVLEHIGSTVQSALRERFSLSIRTRITLGFLLFFFLSAAATITVWYTVNSLEKRLHFLELADRYTFEIQQARRFEKNYFLYGTNLTDVLEHVETAQHLLAPARVELSSIVGKEKLKTMEENLEQYRALLVRTIELDHNRRPGVIPENPEIEAELRRHGAAMVSVALSLSEKERRAVEVTLRLFKRLPIIFLAILLALVIYVANFLARQMIGPLSRLIKTTQRIAQGDFTPHMPMRRYRDEFTDLAIAINRMEQEILRRQEILVESQKLRALGTLTAGVAHELNNPLGNISSSCQILVEELDDRISDYHKGLLSAIEGQVIKARDIVRALLEFSREQAFELKPVALDEIVEDTLKLIKGEIPAGVQVNVEIQEGIVLDLDKVHMERALLNLIMNGIQAIREEGTLTIRASMDPGSDVARLEVIDTGEGIPEENLHRIFDPFFTTKDVGHGTGLGLSVTYGIIERHGGRVSVESEVNKGTWFTIDLPIKGGTN